MWAYQNPDDLCHYGILGMKWGVRRASSTSGASSKNRSKKRTYNQSDDYKEYQRIKKKHVSEMSNAELRKLNDRMNLEQNYSRLNPSKVKKGLAVAAATATALGTMATLYNNSMNVINIGKKVVSKMKK